MRLKFWVGFNSYPLGTLSLILTNLHPPCTLCSRSGTTELLPVVDAPMSCGYEVNTLKNVLNVPFTGCHVKYLATCNVSMELSRIILLSFAFLHVLSQQATTYSLQFLYVNKIGQHKVATAICEEERQPSPRSGGSPLPCPLTTTAVPITPSSTTAQITVPQSLPDLNGESEHVHEARFSTLDSMIKTLDWVIMSVKLSSLLH